MSHRKVTDDKINKALDAQVDSGDEDELESQNVINQQEILSKSAIIKQEIQSYLNRGCPEDAMKSACKDSSKHVIEALIPIFNDIVGSGKLSTDKFVSSLTTNELDVCMKYIYKSMESLTKGLPVNISNVLLFHEKVVNQAGVGSIVRVIADTQ
eukprot:NODE_36_length_31474_cov_0.342438.p20 type:complete len:154 gc:universal NODE_36_length_31474_cov_0.342438:5362-5823(+)